MYIYSGPRSLTSLTVSILLLLKFVQVNGDLWDLERPLEGDCSLEFLKFDHELGKCLNRMCVALYVHLTLQYNILHVYMCIGVVL